MVAYFKYLYGGSDPDFRVIAHITPLVETCSLFVIEEMRDYRDSPVAICCEFDGDKQYMIGDYVQDSPSSPIFSSPKVVATLMLNESCRHNDVQMGEFWISRGARNFDQNLVCSCKYGHVEFAQLMVSNGMKYAMRRVEGRCISQIEMTKQRAGLLNKCLVIACEQNNTRLMAEMIKSGANAFDDCLYIACRNGWVDLVEWLIGNYNIKCFNDGLHGACKSKNIKLAILMIKKGATKCTRCKSPVELCCLFARARRTPRRNSSSPLLQSNASRILQSNGNAPQVSRQRNAPQTWLNHLEPLNMSAQCRAMI